MKLWLIGLYRVSGTSMLPAYRPGDLVLGWRWFTPQEGKVVIINTPERPIIKRIKRLEPGQVWVEGDSSEQSTDSRTQGLYPIERVEAKVIVNLGMSSS